MNSIKDIIKTICDLARRILGWLCAVPGALATARQRTYELTDRHEAPSGPDVPEDLRDVQGACLVDAEGYTVAGEMLPQDVIRCDHAPAWHVLKTIAEILAVWWAWDVAVGSASGGLFMWLAIGGVAWFLASPAVILLPAATMAVGGTLAAVLGLVAHPGVGNAAEAGAADLRGALVAGAVAVGASVGLALVKNMMWWWKRKEHAHTVPPAGQMASAARKEQAKLAAQDTSPFLRLGTSTGMLRQATLDPLAPDSGMPMGLTTSDLSTHLLVLGGTGTGKTSGVFRPLVRQWCERQAGGLLVLDGKGQLPAELSSSLDGYELIAPDLGHQVNPIAGLLPEDVVDALKAVQPEQAEDKDATWRMQAERLAYYAGCLLEAAHAVDPKKAPWTLASFSRVVNSAKYRQELAAMLSLPDGADITDLAADAWTYFRDDFGEQPDGFRGSVVGTLNSWLGPLLTHRHLRGWVSEEGGLDVTQVLSGARMGLALPAFRFGTAGALVSALIKQRIYRGIQRRGDGWRKMEGQTAVLLAIDEAPAVLTDSDVELAPVARSLGLSLVCGAQTVEQIHERFGPYAGPSLLAQFQSIIAFRSSHDTHEWVSERVGEGTVLKDAPTEPATSMTGTVAQAAGVRHSTSFRMTSVLSALKSSENLLSVIKPDTGPLVPLAHLDQMLQYPGTAFASFQRGRVARRDFVRTMPEYA